MDYQERFYSEVFFPYLIENDIKHILHLGDYYDNRKTINFKALQHNRKIFLEPMRELGITMDIIPGNHDVYYKNTNELNALKELQGHYMNEVNLVMKPTVVDYDGMAIALVPWINTQNEKESLEFLANCKADIVGAHLELQGFEMSKGMPCMEGMDRKHFDRFDMVMTGHFHAKSTQNNIHYLGSQMEFFWNDCNDPKHFHVLDTETRELTPVVNPITIYEKIYYDHENMRKFKDLKYLDNKFVKVIVTNKGDPYEFERFIDRVQSQKIHELKIAEDFKEFTGENVSDNVSVDDTETLVYDYVDSVNTDLDKGRIKKEISYLMKEAQSMEIV
jgi:DNA repair exonuclease SbcCD nuclease subunit|tara:strand:+ start:9960 stop:10955 length:996 start_codon:yes stop_codon:yes gene_type:complete